MARKRSSFPLLLVAATLLAAPARTARAGPDDEGFPFRVDPAVFEVLFTDVDTNSSKYEEYLDRREGVLLPRLHLYGQSEDGVRVFDLTGIDVTRDHGRWTLDYGKSGSYGLSLDFNQILHRFGNGGSLIWARTAPGVYALSDATQGALQKAIADKWAVSKPGVNFAFLDGLLKPYLDASTPVDLKLKRERTRARLDIGKMGRLAWTAEFSHENRQGTRPYGAGFGFSNVTEMPEPIDYDTWGAGIAAEWNGDRAGVRAGYTWSAFRNHVESLLYDNPFRLTDATDASSYSAPGSGSIGGAARGRNALAPDNQSHNFNLTARTKLGDDGWADGSLSWTSMKQDEELLPYSTNSAITAATGAPFDVTDPANLPVERADADVRALQLAGRAGYKLTDSLSIEGKVRWYDYDNRSVRVEFPGYVRFDAVWEEIGRITVPYSYDRLTWGGNLTFRVARGTHLRGGFERRSMNRTFREIADSDEDVLFASFDTSALTNVLFRASFEHGNRKTGEYDVEAQEESFTHPEGANNLGSLRKFDEAERRYNSGRVLVHITPSDKVDLSIGYSGRKDDYHESLHGLLEDKIWGVDGEIGFHPRPDVSLYAFGSRTDRESFQRARQSGATLSTREIDDWELTLEETTDTLGAGLSADLSRRWSCELRAQWSKVDGNSDFFSPPGGTPDAAIGFDEYDDNEFFTLSARLRYKLDDHVSAGLAYWREKYDADRFARDGLKPYLPGTLLLNANDGDYAANLFAATLDIHF